MIVVTQEKPGGSSRRYGSETSRRKARSPELRSGILVCASRSATLRITHFAGTRRNLCVPSSVVRAPTTWSTSGLSIEVLRRTRGCARSGRSCRRRSTRRYRPYASAVPIRRAVPEPPLRRNGISRMCGKCGSASCRTLSVPSVDLSSMTSSSYENSLASIAAADALDLGHHVVLLVVAGQHDGDVERVGTAPTRRQRLAVVRVVGGRVVRGRGGPGCGCRLVERLGDAHGAAWYLRAGTIPALRVDTAAAAGQPDPGPDAAGQIRLSPGSP